MGREGHAYEHVFIKLSRATASLELTRDEYEYRELVEIILQRRTLEVLKHDLAAVHRKVFVGCAYEQVSQMTPNPKPYQQGNPHIR